MYNYFVHDTSMTETAKLNTWSRRRIQQRIDKSHFVATYISRPESVHLLFVGGTEGYSLCE